MGAIDVATDRIETAEDVAATIRSALRHVPTERLFPCTNCGMVPLAREVARGKLRALAAGAALVRAELGASDRRPDAVASWGGGGAAASENVPFRAPKKPLALRASRRVSSAKCFSFKAVSTPLYDRFAVVPPSFFP